MICGGGVRTRRDRSAGGGIKPACPRPPGLAWPRIDGPGPIGRSAPADRGLSTARPASRREARSGTSVSPAKRLVDLIKNVIACCAARAEPAVEFGAEWRRTRRRTGRGRAAGYSPRTGPDRVTVEEDRIQERQVDPLGKRVSFSLTLAPPRRQFVGTGLGNTGLALARRSALLIGAELTPKLTIN